MTWSVKKIALLLGASGTLALAGYARAEEPLPSGWLESQTNEAGQACERHALHREERRLLVACGRAGVWELLVSEVGPRFVRSHPFAGEAIGFFTEPDGRLWVKLHVLEARPFVSGSAPPAVRFPDVAPVAPPAPVAKAAPPASAPASRVGRVVSATPGAVVISLGAADGVMRSDRIELAAERFGGDESGSEVLSRDALAVGVVTNVTDHSARVQLGLNEQVPVGAVAGPTRAQATGSFTAPPRVGGLWTLELSAQPFAALGELGGGLLLRGALARRFAGNWRLQAIVDPFAFADVESQDAVTATNATLLASYDSQYFEMGLGFGAQTVNEVEFGVAPGSGLAVAQLIRLGAQDGLNFSARTSIVLFHSEFGFGGMVASGQIPVTRGYWLRLSGGGGDVGYGFGEFGLRVLLDGNGHAGSKFLTVTAGGAAVFRTAPGCDEFLCGGSLTYGGPMAGIAGEWRF